MKIPTPLQNLFSSLFNDRGAREKWDAGLLWFRLRYLETDGPTRCLNLLSRPDACGRATLYYCPGEPISRLYLGVPATHLRLLKSMAADFDFSLKRMGEIAIEKTIPAAERMTAVPDLPWKRPFLAQLVDGVLFLSADGEERKSRGGGRFLPRQAKRAPSIWRLPVSPPPGLTMRQHWNGRPAPAHLVAGKPDPRRWLLGRSREGFPLHAAGRVNLYGRREAVADWLTRQIAQTVVADHANLIVIDGAGDLVPRLKRKTAVTRLLGEGLTYVDIGDASQINGFNPLAAVSGETEESALLRWQRWFQGMNVGAEGLQLLGYARKEGAGDIPSLRKWLKKFERQGRGTAVAGQAALTSVTQAVSSLNMALNRLTANPALREWLEWPTNRFDALPKGALFFACQGTEWDRRQLLRAALLAALSSKDSRLIIHGYPWKEADAAALGGRRQLIVGNGPLLPESVVVLTESRPQDAVKLAARFLSGHDLLGENLSLLDRGDGIVVADGDIFCTSWTSRQFQMAPKNV